MKATHCSQDVTDIDGCKFTGQCWKTTKGSEQYVVHRLKGKKMTQDKNW